MVKMYEPIDFKQVRKKGFAQQRENVFNLQNITFLVHQPPYAVSKKYRSVR